MATTALKTSVLRTAARDRAKREGTSYCAALDAVAREHGFRHWSDFLDARRHPAAYDPTVAAGVEAMLFLGMQALDDIPLTEGEHARANECCVQYGRTDWLRTSCLPSDAAVPGRNPRGLLDRIPDELGPWQRIADKFRDWVAQGSFGDVYAANLFFWITPRGREVLFHARHNGLYWSSRLRDAGPVEHLMEYPGELFEHEAAAPVEDLAAIEAQMLTAHARPSADRDLPGMVPARLGFVPLALLKRDAKVSEYHPFGREILGLSFATRESGLAIAEHAPGAQVGLAA